MITIDEKTTAIWYLMLNEKQDWLAMLARTTKDNVFEITCRFKYYGNDKTGNPLSTRNRKNWYTLQVRGTEKEVFEKAREMAHFLASKAGAQLDETLVKNGDINQFIREIRSKPWAHEIKSGTA